MVRLYLFEFGINVLTLIHGYYDLNHWVNKALIPPTLMGGTFLCS
jgi:hypothetical protein